MKCMHHTDCPYDILRFTFCLQRISEVNKKNRENHKINHTSGTLSYAMVEEEMVVLSDSNFLSLRKQTFNI